MPNVIKVLSAENGENIEKPSDGVGDRSTWRGTEMERGRGEYESKKQNKKIVML